VAPVDPVTAPSLEPDLVLAGTWTVQYRVGPENGYGVNIDLPLRHLDRQTIRPGRTFDFWKAVGEVSRRAGYRMSGVIVGDHIDPNGAIGGGICTVSSALFNAAARAGLAITARTSHGVYLAKYPLGLDAAVAKDVGWAQTMAFRNDTRQTLLIRTVSAPGIARVDLYAAESLGRTVTFSDPRISHRVKATDRHLRTSALPAGTHQRRRDGSDGMVVVVDRLVADATGRIIHRDRWISRYRPLRGLVLDGIG
jgi:vancomycin resistance protein YoaR